MYAIHLHLPNNVLTSPTKNFSSLQHWCLNHHLQGEQKAQTKIPSLTVVSPSYSAQICT